MSQHEHDAAAASEQYPATPGPVRGLLVIALIGLAVFFLSRRVESGTDEVVSTIGRIEVSARLVERPDQFPQLGAYRYTYVLKYEVLRVHRQDPSGKYRLNLGDIIFVGHYKPWMPRSSIKDTDWGDAHLGGKADQLLAGAVHRMALDYELEDLAPSGSLDYCYPAGTNRFFALWTNPTSL